jgi:NAD-dependent dihydropyrimidine dehydrogenase PreA subunit
MIFVAYEDCNGCGACLDSCTVGAIIIQNNKATIDQALCDGCQACIEACPLGAIIIREAEPVPKTIALVEPVESLPMQNQAARSSLLSMIIPAIGSAILWTGREILPRLATLTLNSLDQRINAVDSGPTYQQPLRRDRRSARAGGKRRRRKRIRIRYKK